MKTITHWILEFADSPGSVAHIAEAVQRDAVESDAAYLEEMACESKLMEGERFILATAAKRLRARLA
jgi:hypothetical protein